LVRCVTVILGRWRRDTSHRMLAPKKLSALVE
jgi:hypothetical protein